MVWLSVFGLVSFAFQSGCWAGIFRFFIIGGRGCLCLRLRLVGLWSIVGFALTAIGSFVLTDNGMEYLCVRSLDCMGYLFSGSFNCMNAVL